MISLEVANQCWLPYNETGYEDVDQSDPHVSYLCTLDLRCHHISGDQQLTNHSPLDHWENVYYNAVLKEMQGLARYLADYLFSGCDQDSEYSLDCVSKTMSSWDWIRCEIANQTIRWQSRMYLYEGHLNWSYRRGQILSAIRGRMQELVFQRNMVPRNEFFMAKRHRDKRICDLFTHIFNNGQFPLLLQIICSYDLPKHWDYSS
jgi:hypothetical protein